MNERFVAVSTVTGSRICGCFSKPRSDFSVTRGWQQMTNTVRWIQQFAEKITAMICRKRQVNCQYRVSSRSPATHGTAVAFRLRML